MARKHRKSPTLAAVVEHWSKPPRLSKSFRRALEEAAAQLPKRWKNTARASALRASSLFSPALARRCSAGSQIQRDERQWTAFLLR
ncbi:MAG: hypothetical protein M3Y41_13745 [Pseudomonadota bacterium]|nr:hypothetical protein [Pseudomonadota bacterium]